MAVCLQSFSFSQLTMFFKQMLAVPIVFRNAWICTAKRHLGLYCRQKNTEKMQLCLVTRLVEKKQIAINEITAFFSFLVMKKL